VFGAAEKTKRTLAVLTLALAGCRAPIQAVTPTPEIVSLNFVTTNSTTPILRTLAANYQRDNALVAVVEQSEHGLTISPTEQEDVTYALTTYLYPDHRLWSAPIGQDGIAIISHPELRLEKLTARDLRAIFSGAVTRWSQVSSQAGNILVVSRGEDSATRLAFQDLVMGSRSITFNARLAPSSQAMLDIVASTPGAIGFVSFSMINEGVRLVPVAARADMPGLVPSLSSIFDEVYPLRMPLLFVGPNPPTPGDGYYEFILWAQSEGQAVIAERYAPLPTQP
jgi:ABC-type phosphate transport system substrate-binding protein